MPRLPRISRGRRRVEMRKMTNENNLLVTFSKRRDGLFKKASELCTLCGAEVLVIVFSPKMNPFSFGHPSVEELIDRFESRQAITSNNPNPDPDQEFLEFQRNQHVNGLNMQFSSLHNQLEMDRKKGEELTKKRNDIARSNWWGRPTEDLEIHQLEKVKLALEVISEKAARQKEKMRLEGEGPSGGPYFMGACPSRGGQALVTFQPQVPQPAQPEVTLRQPAPSQDPNGMGYGGPGYFGRQD